MNTRSEKPSFSESIWRRGELHYGGPLKSRNLLILRYAQYAKNAQSARRRYTAGTRNISMPIVFQPRFKKAQYQNWPRTFTPYKARESFSVSIRRRTTCVGKIHRLQCRDAPAVPNHRFLTKKDVYYELIERRFFGTS